MKIKNMQLTGGHIISSKPPDKGHGYWYRYVDRPSDSVGRYNGILQHKSFGVSIEREEYPVLRVTPKGVVLDIGRTNPRWVKNGTMKQFAHPDDKEAMESFVYRKKAQRRILNKQIDRADAAFIAGQELLGKMP